MNKHLGTASLLIGLMISGSAFASGYEKTITWGGRAAGVGSVATPYIQGPQSLYFNPAGLASDKVGHQVDFNLTALSSQFKGPIENSNAQVESDRKMLTPFGLIYGNTMNEKFGYGIGAYVSGGSQAKFDNLTIGASTGNTVETELTIAEVAAGVGYKVTDKLKVGLAYRVLIANGQFAFVQRGAGGSVVNAKVTDLEAMNFTGYKLGAQYQLSESTQLGLSYRSQVDISAKGKIGGNLFAGSNIALDENDATAKTTLPQALTLGALHKFGDSWNVMGEYVWTQYSRVEHVTLDGAVTRSGGTVIAADATDLEQQWKDQHQVKLAGEYVAMPMPIRFGYVWTSQVTHDDYARASFTPPGNAHTVTLGTGKQLGESFQLDGALDYTWVSGTGNGAAAGTTTAGSDIRAGEYEASAYSLHMGLSYSF